MEEFLLEMKKLIKGLKNMDFRRMINGEIWKK